MESGEKRAQKRRRPGPALGPAVCLARAPAGAVSADPSGPTDMDSKHEAKAWAQNCRKTDIQPAVSGSRAKLGSSGRRGAEATWTDSLCGPTGALLGWCPNSSQALPFLRGPHTREVCVNQKEVAPGARGSLASSQSTSRGSLPPTPRTQLPACRGHCTSWWTQPVPAG